jgi:hypothetical protein
MTIAGMVAKLTAEEPPLRFEAYDGSGFGPTSSPITMRLLNERGLRYLATAVISEWRAPTCLATWCSRECTRATRTTL